MRQENGPVSGNGASQGPSVHKGGHKGPYGVDPTSPWKETKSGPRIKKKKIIYDMNEDLRSRGFKKKSPAPLHLPQPKPLVDVETMLAVERKWQAVAEFREMRALGISTNQTVDQIGEKWDVGSGRNVRILSEKAELVGSLMRKEGSGAPKTVSNRLDIQEFFAAQALEWEYEFTMEAMADAIQEQFNVGSISSVKAIMEFLEYRKAKRVVRPLLTHEHILARLAWAEEWMDFDFHCADIVVCHLDEKCFYAFSNRGRTVYLPPGVDPEPLFALSKTQIPWVMFLGVVAAPRPQFGFDGKIGLFHVGEEKEAKRRSKFHEKGDVYWTNINMDGDVFMEMVEHEVVPAIKAKLPWAKKVIVQIDSAGGHRVKESLDYLNRLCPRIQFRTQPTRSPDCNVLDLGIWNSMNKHVRQVKYDRTSLLSMDQRIINAVNDMWENYDTNKLHNIFITLNTVLKSIKENNGGNSFKQPHCE